ncbi:hypothetical protein EDM76_12805 [bacterium]|nr:MAG: hypothetical protein EDM76_12805 [bacterium]MCL4232853.1 hypothetical protein [Dehalococcoidia bacterium]
MKILVLAPEGMATDPVAGCDVVACRSVGEIARALAGEFAAAVLVSDGLPAADLEQAAGVVRACRFPVIEVRSERWDGTAYSPLSAACRGVISGFGAAGIVAAAGLARDIAP